MSIRWGIEGSEPLRPQPIQRLGGPQEVRPDGRRMLLATGTLACPACDAPVLPSRSLTPSEPLECPYCAHRAATRDFLSLAAPARPARVAVWVRITHRISARADPR